MWQTVKLGEICDLTGGGTPSKQEASYYDGDILWATVRDMSADELNKTEHKITQKGLENSSSKVIRSGNIIIASRVGLGKACILGQDTAINQDLRGVLPKKKEVIETRYLFYWFKSVSNYIISAGRGATVHGVTLPFLNSLELPLPPLPVQKQIVEKLDVAFANIDKAINATEKNIENAEALFYSTCKKVINSIQSDKSSLGSFAEISSGGTPSKKTKEFWDGNIAWFSSGELNDLYTKDPDDRITEEGLGKSNAKLFPKGSLLIGMYDTAALKMSILDREGTFNQAICGLKPNNRVDMQYIYYALNVVKPEVLKLRSGVRQQNLNQSKIKNIEIIFPELVIQKEISYKLNKIFQKQDKLIEIYEQKLSHLISLKSSIFNHAFSGELTKDTA